MAYEGAKANADKMRQMHDKLVADIEELNARKATIKAKARRGENSVQGERDDLGWRPCRGCSQCL